MYDRNNGNPHRPQASVRSTASNRFSSTLLEHPFLPLIATYIAAGVMFIWAIPGMSSDLTRVLSGLFIIATALYVCSLDPKYLASRSVLLLRIVGATCFIVFFASCLIGMII